MAELKLVNRRGVPVEVRIIPLDDESSILDPNDELYSLDDVSFEYGIRLKNLPLLPVFDVTVEIIDIVGSEEEVEEIDAVKEL